MITVTRVEADRWEVTVDGPPPSRHQVRLSDDVWRRLADRRVTHEALIMESFRFLLEREPNTSILERFDLEQIGNYFPEWEDAMRSWVDW